MYRPMLVRRYARTVLAAMDGLLLRRVGSVATKSSFERISTTIGQECGHSCCTQACGGRVIKWIIAVLILRIRVYALPLSLTPAYAPSAVAGRRRNWDNRSNILLAKICPFKAQHATHGSTYHCRNLPNSEIVKDDFVNATACKCLVPTSVR